MHSEPTVDRRHMPDQTLVCRTSVLVQSWHVAEGLSVKPPGCCGHHEEMRDSNSLHTLDPIAAINVGILLLTGCGQISSQKPRLPGRRGQLLHHAIVINIEENGLKSEHPPSATRAAYRASIKSKSWVNSRWRKWGKITLAVAPHTSSRGWVVASCAYLLPVLSEDDVGMATKWQPSLFPLRRLP